MTERGKIKEFTQNQHKRSKISTNSFRLLIIVEGSQGHILSHFGTNCDTGNTSKKRFLSKKGPKEGERVARGHFHERVGESPVHWLPPGVGFTQKPFSVSENGPIENFLRSNSIFI